MIKKQTLFALVICFLQAFNLAAIFKLDQSKKHPVCIVIPAYNEGERIEKTLDAYCTYFKNEVPFIKATVLVVANNCRDNTVEVCKRQQKKHKNIQILDLKPGGKGFAVKKGFEHALKKKYELIGFVDADMATAPEQFLDLIVRTDGYDGAIASRRVKGSVMTTQPEPLVKTVGRKAFLWVVQMRFGLNYKDTQCGAKVFTQDTIKKVTPDMYENKWFFDIELLYLCKLNHKSILEAPTVWHDQPGSHVHIDGSLIKEFMTGQGRVLKRHAKKEKQYRKEKRAMRKEKRKAKRADRKAKRKADIKRRRNLKKKKNKERRELQKDHVKSHFSFTW